MRSENVLPDLVFIREGHEAACLLKSRTGDDMAIDGVARNLMACQVVLPFESVTALGALERARVLMHRFLVR